MGCGNCGNGNGTAKATAATKRTPEEVAAAAERAGWPKTLPVLPACDHWVDAGIRGGGRCSAGHYTDPALGVCLTACRHYTGPLEDRVDRAAVLIASRGGPSWTREQVAALVTQNDGATLRAKQAKAIRATVDRTAWRFERWLGIWWMGKPWPLRLTWNPIVGIKPARRDGLLWWTRLVPGLRERDTPGCGCIAALKIMRDCWTMSRQRMAEFLAEQQRQEAEGKEASHGGV